MVAPTGGDEDATAPILVSVSENTTKTTNEVHFVFNEYILFISTLPGSTNIKVLFAWHEYIRRIKIKTKVLLIFFIYFI